MFARVTLLALLAVGLAEAGRIVYPGPHNGYQLTNRAALVTEPVATPRQLENGTTAEDATSSCPSEPPEGTTEETLDLACFEMTDQVDLISTYTALDNQCKLGFVRRKRDSECVFARRVGRSNPKKKTSAAWVWP